jgi:hypothetical protein
MTSNRAPAGRATPQTPTATIEPLLTEDQAAKKLNVSPSWLAKARMRGDGPPYVKIGRSVRYGDVVAWAKARMRFSTSEQ